MTQAIDPGKLKAAAEHLEWVLKQYPDVIDVQNLYGALRLFIEAAKAQNILLPVESIPCGFAFGDGVYESYKTPNVDEAYVAFAIEMEGGLSEQDKKLQANTEILQAMIRGNKS